MGGGRKNLNFGNLITKILAAQCSARQVKCLKCQVECSKRKPIVVTKLPKLQGSEKRENKNCGNQVAENGREKEEEENCGNQVAENLGRNLIVIQAMKLPKMRGKKDLGQKLKEKKKLWQLNCGNEIAKMGGKKNSSN